MLKRVLGLVSQLPERYYTMSMDNIYMSDQIFILAFRMGEEVMIFYVVRPTLIGVPPIIKQDEVKNKC